MERKQIWAHFSIWHLGVCLSGWELHLMFILAILIGIKYVLFIFKKIHVVIGWWYSTCEIDNAAVVLLAPRVIILFFAFSRVLIGHLLANTVMWVLLVVSYNIHSLVFNFLTSIYPISREFLEVIRQQNLKYLLKTCLGGLPLSQKWMRIC